METETTGAIVAFANFLVHWVESWGYPGLFVLTFLESTFVPLPSEVTMIPAGYLVHQGEMNFFIVMICSILGTLVGSLFNYWLAIKLGRATIVKYGHYIHFHEHHMQKMEKFFARYGNLSIFVGRLVMGVRHFIAFPAGLARMPLKPFMIYTVLGSTIWLGFLVGVGYYIGQNKEWISAYLPWVKLGIAVAAVAGMVWYVRKPRGESDSQAQ